MDGVLTADQPVYASAGPIRVKENKKVIKQIWEKLVKVHVFTQKTIIKATPLILKIVSVFVPEIAPVEIALDKFFKTETGKKVMEVSEKNTEALGDMLTGKTDEAMAKYKENLDSITGKDRDEIAGDIRNLVTDIKATGAMEQDNKSMGGLGL